MGSDSVESFKNNHSSNEELPKVSKDATDMETNIRNNLATHILDPNMDVRVVDTGACLLKRDVEVQERSRTRSSTLTPPLSFYLSSCVQILNL